MFEIVGLTQRTGLLTVLGSGLLACRQGDKLTLIVESRETAALVWVFCWR